MRQPTTIPPVFLILFSSLPALLIMLTSAMTSRPEANPYAFEFQKSGSGEKSIVFIPGFASSASVWDETKAKYEKQYTCYTLTMAGFAGVAPQANATFKNWEASIARFIQENHLNKPILVGHSMGGVLAMALASDYPDLIGKIVVVDALPCLSALSNPSFQSAAQPDCSAMVQQITAANDDQFYQLQKRTMKGLIADTARQAMVVDWSMKSDRNTLGEMFCDFSNTDLREQITKIECPALILLEPYFKNVSGAMEGQYKNLKTAQLQYATRGLHFIMYDDKEWYFRQLDHFIAKQ